MVRSNSLRVEVAVRIRPSQQLRTARRRPNRRGDLGHDLLRQNVQRRLRDVDAVEPPC